MDAAAAASATLVGRALGRCWESSKPTTGAASRVRLAGWPVGRPGQREGAASPLVARVFLRPADEDGRCGGWGGTARGARLWLRRRERRPLARRSDLLHRPGADGRRHQEV